MCRPPWCRWIVRVLVADQGGVDVEGATLGVREIDVRDDREGRRAALTETVWSPLVAQVSVNPPSATSTGSLNVTEAEASDGNAGRAVVGSVETTVGASSAARS
jgi:hypothetical protein